MPRRTKKKPAGPKMDMCDPAPRERHERRTISKIELLPGKKNLRFIVTNLPGEGGENDGNKTRFRSQELYEDFHCARGEIENRLKEQPMNFFAERFPL